MTAWQAHEAEAQEATRAAWQTVLDLLRGELARQIEGAGFTPGDRRAFLALPLATQVRIEVLEQQVHEASDAVREFSR